MAPTGIRGQFPGPPTNDNIRLSSMDRSGVVKVLEVVRGQSRVMGAANVRDLRVESANGRAGTDTPGHDHGVVRRSCNVGTLDTVTDLRKRARRRAKFVATAHGLQSRITSAGDRFMRSI